MSQLKKIITATPLPGKPVKGSNSGRPIMAALNLLSRRWVLRIIWELQKESVGFREIQKKCEKMSPDTLSTRLSELREAGIVMQEFDGTWKLTQLGIGLQPALEVLLHWSNEWACQLQGGESK